ncbi:MAG: hypothetical protein ACI94Y_004025 [Maribacter sp.]|jgi:hypothetical protein
MAKKLISIILFFVFINNIYAQNQLLPNDLKNTTWQQMEIINRDTIKIKQGGDSCSLPIEIIFYEEFDDWNCQIFKRKINTIEVGEYGSKFCSFDPETYKETIEINSCPLYVCINKKKNNIWYLVGQSLPREKYKLVFYKKDTEIILKGKRGSTHQQLIFRK